MKLEYYRDGDYLFPNLVLEEAAVTIGKYGMLRRTFLKEHKKNWYQSMLLTGKLDRHLLEVEKMADERLDILMKGLLQSHPEPDKEADQLAWAAHMNGLMEMAEEIVLSELVYSYTACNENPQSVWNKKKTDWG